VTTKITDVQQGDGSTAPDLSALADQLVAAARTQGGELTGPGGLLTGLTKQVLETRVGWLASTAPSSPSMRRA
jgi:putative transposase